MALRKRARSAADTTSTPISGPLCSEDSREIHTIENTRHFNVGDYDIDGLVPLQLA